MTDSREPSDPSLPPAAAGAAPRSRARRQRVQAAETGVAVLKGLADLGGRATLTALSAHVQEPPAKVHRYLASLAEEGLVSQDAGTQQYFLGPEAIRIGMAAMRQADRPRRSPFDRLDTDRDGFVSRAEFNAGSEQIFARCDKNGDGRITRGECRTTTGERAQARPAQRRDPPTQ